MTDNCSIIVQLVMTAERGVTSMVPMKLLVRASSFIPCFANPKSVTLMWPSLSRSTFS